MNQGQVNTVAPQPMTVGAAYAKALELLKAGRLDEARHPDDIIASKRAANRVKDRESLGRLEEFARYWRGGGGMH